LVWNRPRAGSDYVSHTVCDHMSVLKLCERKWNLRLPRTDEAANDFLDMVDFTAPPAFAPSVRLPANPALHGCVPGDAGVIPPPLAVISI
jgi:hypothetical protein